MNTFLYWLGAIVWAGTLLAIGVTIWWCAVTTLLGVIKETWWIAAYACYKRRNGGRESARRALDNAIRSSAIYDANPKDERIQPDVSPWRRLWFALGLLMGLIAGALLGWHFLSGWNPCA